MERDTRFKAGFDLRRNLNGRKKGSRNFKTLMVEAVSRLEKEHPEIGDLEVAIARNIIVGALKGDARCMKIFLDSMYGKVSPAPRNRAERPIKTSTAKVTEIYKMMSDVHISNTKRKEDELATA